MATVEKLQNDKDGSLNPTPSSSSNYSTPTSDNLDMNHLNDPHCDDSTRYDELVEQTKLIMDEKFSRIEKVMNQAEKLDFAQDEDEITKLRNELHEKEKLIEKMSAIKDEVEGELADLTASLFEEANKMVHDANVLREKAQKELREANFRIDMLTAEVKALKILVISSIPPQPDAMSHDPYASILPVIHAKFKSENPVKSTSNYELGDKESVYKKTESVTTDVRLEMKELPTGTDYDPMLFDEFQKWHRKPNLDPMFSEFMKRIYDEDVYPLFDFKNKDLSSLVLRAIETNSLTIEAVNVEKSSFPKKCSLLEVQRICPYRMKITDQVGSSNNDWYLISNLCRNRITSVCDLFCYLRYIKLGLVKSKDPKDIFFQIMKRRANISLSRLGYNPF